MHKPSAGTRPWSAESILGHVQDELCRLDLVGVLSAEDGGHVVRRDPYAGSIDLDLPEFSALAATLADGSGLRGLYLARDGYRDDELVRALNASLARGGIEGYTARHCTSSVEHGVAVTDAHGHALPRPARDSHGRALLRLLETLADGSGLAAYGVALLAADEPSARV